MDKLKSYFSKIFKVILWITLGFVILFVVIAALIQIPAIQTKIVHSATTFVSNKTHTKAEINKVSISFPKSVVIEGIYLEDLQNDTLLYAGMAEINITLFNLISKKITINSLALEDATFNIFNTKSDSLFNYNFLITAFGDNGSRATATPSSPSKWTFSLGDVSLKNIRFRYDDEYGGMNVSASLRNLELKIDEIDPAKSIYSIENLLVENLGTSIQMKKSEKESSSENVLPKISAEKLQIINSEINFTDSVGGLALFSTISQVELKDAAIDLQQQQLTAETIYLAKSDITYNNFKTTDSTNVSPDSATENAWKVSVKNIDLNDNSLAYNSGTQPELKNSFDPNHLKYNHFTLEANDLYYSPDLTKVTVKKFSAVDQNNFSIKRFEGSFSMDQHSITVKKLLAGTASSSIDADFNIQYSSFTGLTDSIQFNPLNLTLRKLTFKNSDVLYFNPELKTQPFFNNYLNVTTVSGTFNGALNNLTGKNLVVKTGSSTVLQTNFNIAGLPDVQTAVFNFPDLKISSNKNDIEMLADTLLPENIGIPDSINLAVDFGGKLKDFEAVANVTSSFGNVNLTASVRPEENFNSQIILTDLDLGSLLKDTALYGPVSLTAEASGQGFDLKSVKAKIKAEVTTLTLNKYDYQNIKMDGSVAGQIFEGKINLEDENIEFELDATANLNPGQEQVQFRMNVPGADLQKLSLSETDLRVGFAATAEFKGKSFENINGKAKITNFVIAHETEKYALDSIVFDLVNEPDRSEISINSALVNLHYSGKGSVFNLPSELSQFVNNYFQLSDSVSSNVITQLQDFTFEMQLFHHPVLAGIIFSELYEFQPGIIQGSFNSQTNELKLYVPVTKIVYGSTEINDFTIDVISDVNVLNFQILFRNISNSQFGLQNLLIDGNLASDKMNTTISSIDEKNFKKLQISSQLTRENSSYKLTIDPDNFYLKDKKWNIAADNFIEFGEQGFLIHHLFMNDEESQVTIASVNDKFNDDIRIGILNFELGDISEIAAKDSGLVKGTADGNVLLKRVNNSYGLIADAKIMNLGFSDIPIGNLTVKAENPTTEKFNVEVNLSGEKNNLTADGYFVPNGGDQSILFNAVIQSLSLQTVQAFSMGAITKASGNLTGNFRVEGDISLPQLTGELVFNNAFITPAFLNNPLELKHETLQVKEDGIYFNSFTILDSRQHTAILNGAVNMNRFSDYKLALNINTKDFLLLNTTSADNKEFFGSMIIDSKIDITGPVSLPVVNATIKLKNGSNFTFVVPEEELTTDRGEDVVEFETETNLNPILYPEKKKEIQKTGLTGFDVSSTLEIDKEATLRLMMDPMSADSLVVRGDAALSFTIDRSGKMSLTGAYNLNDGSYMASLESIIKRRFDIDRGSTIIWNGDPYDAEIFINARYLVRASPIDLMADQLSGLSETDKNGYKQRYPFLVLLKLRGKILQPEITFEIQLPPDEKGILNGVVNQKLSMLNEDESALNKQVFALLVLGRFIQENPLQTEAGGTSTLVRATVGKFLSQQLNLWSSKILPGVDLNFDIQSSNDYQTEQADGRTQVDIGLKKQLFGERLSIELGGTVDVEGERARQNSASNITSDVNVEYKLTKDGRYRLKGFRHNQYEGVIEGQLVETGVGVIYVRDFNKWKEFLKSSEKKSKPSEKGAKK